MKHERKNLIAYCGMDCALCRSYQVNIHKLNEKGFHYKSCPGCNPRGLFCVHMADSCEIIGQGKVDYCFDCENFPCKRLKSLDKRYRDKYHMSMIDNLIMIRDNGMDAFIESQKRFECENCGELKTVHNGLCLNCDWQKLKNNRKYRWGEDETKRNS